MTDLHPTVRRELHKAKVSKLRKISELTRRRQGIEAEVAQLKVEIEDIDFQMGGTGMGITREAEEERG